MSFLITIALLLIAPPFLFILLLAKGAQFDQMVEDEARRAAGHSAAKAEASQPKRRLHRRWAWLRSAVRAWASLF